MSKKQKLLIKILQATSDNNISFNELCELLTSLGFAERIKGSHHIFCKKEIPEIINLQPHKSKSKPYQIKQVRNILINYKLTEIK